MAGLKVKDEYAGLTEAVSLSIAVLKKCRSNTWSELLTAMGEADAFTVKTLKALDLSAAQLALMDRYSPVIDMVTIKPSTVPAVCPACGLYILTADTAPTRCLVTAGCTGKPFKVVAATAGPSPEPEAMLPPETDGDDADSSPETAKDDPADTAEADPVADWTPELDGPEDPDDDFGDEPEITVTASDLEAFDDFEDLEDLDDLDAPPAKGPRPVLNLDEDPFA
jgi:hypothetical protein